MFLMTHSTHFIYILYGIEQTIMDHSDIEKGIPLPSLQGLLFPISSKGLYIPVFVTPIVEHLLKQ